MTSHVKQFIITRPEPDNALWVAQLRALGHSALSLPLMEIRPSNVDIDIAEVGDISRYAALMFVSVNAVRHFFAHPQVMAQRSALNDALAQGRLRCWSPGPGTSAALQQAGIAAAFIDDPQPQAAQFESETLWQVVAPQVPRMSERGQSVLIVRGTQGRAWLSEQLRAHGVPTVFLPIYERCAPTPDAAWLAQLAQCRADTDAFWVFSSGECVDNLRALAPDADWRNYRAIATHERIAQRCRKDEKDSGLGLGFGRVWECRPTLADVLLLNTET